MRAPGIPAYSNGSIVRREHETFEQGGARPGAVFSSYKQRSRVYYKQLQHQLQRKAEEGGQTAMVEASPTTSQLLRLHLHNLLQPTEVMPYFG
jgi:hypothetical protein